MPTRLTRSGTQTFIVSDIPAARQNNRTMAACGLAELTRSSIFCAIWMHSRRSLIETNCSNLEFDLFMSATRTRVALKRKCLFHVSINQPWSDLTHCAIQDAENGYPDSIISSQTRIKIVADRTL